MRITFKANEIIIIIQSVFDTSVHMYHINGCRGKYMTLNSDSTQYLLWNNRGWWEQASRDDYEHYNWD